MAGKKRKPTTAKTGQPTRRKIVPAGPKQTGISWPETVIFLFIVAAIFCAAVFLTKPIAGQLQGQLGLDLRGNESQDK